jgi:hypothetical protein
MPVFVSTVVLPVIEHASRKVCPVGVDVVYPVHFPAEHCAGAGQPASHAPQLFGSFVTSTQALPQNALPVGQQFDCEQICPLGHCLPHAPQWSDVAVRSKQPAEPPLSTSQRTMGPPPPSGTPASAGHEKSHCDAAHDGVPGTVPPAGGRHCFPHVPQLLRSLVRSKHPGVPWQTTFGAVQLSWHCPALQICPVAHWCPHAPQFVQSVDVLASQPPPLLPLLLEDES